MPLSLIFYLVCYHALNVPGTVSAELHGAGLAGSTTPSAPLDTAILTHPTNSSTSHLWTGESTPATTLGVGFPTASIQTTGSGLAYAISCQSQLWAWSISSQEYASSNAVTTTSTFDFTYTYTLGGSVAIFATRLTTLCDGNPRVVGQASLSTAPIRFTTSTDAGTYPHRILATDFPVPVPCSINPTDCAGLFSIYTNDAARSGLSRSSQFLDVYPSCTTSQPTTSTGSAGQLCDECYVEANAARLLYWPVTTSRNLCSSNVTQEWKRTADTPKSFVTAGITITSPSVGISLGGVSRLDGCGSTVASTIIVVPPEAVSSVRGARALYAYHPFDFEDLNWICQAPNSTTSTIQQEGGDDCYQDVPLLAYFGGTEQFENTGEFNASEIANVTIGNDYHPQLVYPKVDGHLDPPRALQEQSSVPTLTLPAPAQTTAESQPIAISASPAEQRVSQVSATEVQVTISTSWAVHADESGIAAPSPTNISPSEATAAISASTSVGEAFWSTEDPSNQSSAWSCEVFSNHDSQDPCTPNIQTPLEPAQDHSTVILQETSSVRSGVSEAISTIITVTFAPSDDPDSPQKSGKASNQGPSGGQNSDSSGASGSGFAVAASTSRQIARTTAHSGSTPDMTPAVQSSQSSKPDAQDPSGSDVFSSDAQILCVNSAMRLSCVCAFMAMMMWLSV
nr:hypothetical protein CFP56_52809 [Quercus suber]